MPPSIASATKASSTFGSDTASMLETMTTSNKRKLEITASDSKPAKPSKRTKRIKSFKDILSNKRFGKKKRQLFERNSIESPLLRLPPEVRNRIWGYALGGKTVHIWNDDDHKSKLGKKKRVLKRAICKCDISEEEMADTIKASNGTVQYHSYSTRHSSCMNRTKEEALEDTSWNLSILQTCRQIHSEAALIPFHENAFTFDWILDLEAFVDYLIPTQVSAVQHIEFLYHDFISNPNFEKNLAKKLQGLESFTCFVEFHSGRNSTCDRLDSGVTGESFTDRESVRDEMAKCILRFQRFPLATAKVAAYNLIDSVREDVVPAEISQTWAKAIEEKLTSEHTADAAADAAEHMKLERFKRRSKRTDYR